MMTPANVRKFACSTFVIVASLFIAANSSAQKVARSALNSSFEIHYGVVEQVETVKVQSQAVQGAVMGGLVGAAASGHKHRGRNAAIGAGAGLLLTKALEGKNEAFQYTVNFEDGSLTKVIAETKGIIAGDCVSVELGQTANIRRVSSVHCEHPDHEALAEYDVHAEAHEEASECHMAKEIALKAETEAEMDLALKKVRIFCEN